MARRHWTLTLTDGASRVRRIRISRDAARAAIGVALLLVAVVSSAATRVAEDGTTALRELTLVRKNALLEAEVEDLRLRLDTLRGTLDELSANDDYYRLLAGLEPMQSADAHVAPVLLAATEASPLYELDRRVARRIFATSNDLSSLLRRARMLSFSWREAEDTLLGKHDRLASTPSITPADGHLSSGFSYRRFHPLLGYPRPHLGVDIVAPVGTPIVAAAKGRVVFVGDRGEYGHAVEIDHGYGYVTRYAHASRILVREGQPVQRGDMIALVGQTGLAVGPHVHYEVIVHGRHVNPRRFMIDARVVAD
jgi:murein DD-endopeptidase MepM/ murein hydrolase activator NlpD